MAAQQYYHGDQSFPPPPQDGAPPPYSVHAPQLNGPPQQSNRPPVQNPRPQAKPVPWQQAYNSYNHHPSQHYYAPHSPSVYPPQQGHVQAKPNSPYLRPSPTPYAPRPQNPYPQDRRPSGGYRSSSERRRDRHHHDHKRGESRSKQSHESRDGLLGAAGGGLIGDLILPGAGTLSGIIIGALKGREYGKRKDDKGDSR